MDLDSLHEHFTGDAPIGRGTGKTTARIANLIGELQLGESDHIYLLVPYLKDTNHLIPMIEEQAKAHDIEITHVYRHVLVAKVPERESPVRIIFWVPDMGPVLGFFNPTILKFPH